MTRALAMMVLCVSCAVGVLACQTRTPRSDSRDAAALPVGDHRLLDLPVVTSLPHDVEIFVGISPMEDLARQLGWTSLLARHTGLTSKWGELIEAKVGRSLLELKDLREVGIATARPFGVALLDVERTIACLFVEVRDQASLDAWLRQLARHHGVQLRVETEGLATITWTPALPKVRMVRRSGHLLVVFGDAAPERLHEQARRVALVSAERSLAEVTTFRALSREVGRGALVAAYVRSAALAQSWLGIWDRPADPIFGSFSGAVAGVWPAGDHLRLEGFVGLRPDSLIDRGFGPPTATSDLHGLRSRSLVLTASVRRELFGELLRAGYGATGDPARARKVLTERLRLDLEEDVIGHLDGRVVLLSSRSGGGEPPTLTTSVAATMRRGHEPAQILQAWQQYSGEPSSVGGTVLTPYGLSDRIVWSHGPEPIRADDISVRGDGPLERALVTVRHRPTVMAMTAHAHIWPRLASERPSPTWDAICGPLGVGAVRADRADGGLELSGAVFLRVASLSDYAARVMDRLDR